MSAEDSALPKHPMPHIDFASAFQPDVSANFIPPLNAAPPHPTRADAPAPASAQVRPTRLGRSDWANVIFVIITVLGGLFCAFYFFNAAELMRTVASWPKELLYPRPIQPTFAKIDNYIPPQLANTFYATLGTSEPGPFSHTAQSLLNPQNPQPTFASGSPFTNGSSSAPSIAAGGGALQQLAGVVPGGDTLTRTFTDAAATAAQPATSLANDSAATVANTVAPVKQNPGTASRKLVRHLKSHVPTKLHSNSPPLDSTVKPTTAPAPLVRGAAGGIGGINSSGAIGGIGGVVGINGSGGGAGLGGIGGINGAGGGAGGIGGLNATVHGLLGVRH